MSRTRRSFVRAVSSAAVLAVAGCAGSGGPGAEGSTATQTPTASPIPTETATATDAPTAGQQAYPDYNWAQLDDASAVATDTVVMSGFAFDPLVATVPPGTTVTFSNEDSSSHTVTVPALGVDDTVEGGGETTVTFPDPGTYDYVCRFHGPDMLGRVVVEAGVTVDGSAGTATDGGGSGGGGGYGG